VSLAVGGGVDVGRRSSRRPAGDDIPTVATVVVVDNNLLRLAQNFLQVLQRTTV